MLNRLILLFTALFWFSAVAAAQFTNPTVNRLLQADESPDGVVFEVLAWTWAAPLIADLRRQLQAKFPEIDVAIVSHGGEQFQLTRERIGEQPQALVELESLSDQGVNLHVCGTHSLWNDVAESSYIDIVDVSPSGPAQVNDYIKLGYQHILIRDPPE